MQSERETADFVPMLPPSELNQTVIWRPTGTAAWQIGRCKSVVFHSGPFAPLCDNMTSFTKQNR